MYKELTKKARGDRSIRQFAIDSDVAASYISGIEKGKYNPELNTLIKICNASQKRVSIADFLGSDVAGKAEKLFYFCMSIVTDETQKKLIKMYYEELER